MRKEKYVSKRFKDLHAIQLYFKDVEESPLIDAIRFLAQEIEEGIHRDYRDSVNKEEAAKQHSSAECQAACEKPADTQ